jgi:hypothetical protein
MAYDAANGCAGCCSQQATADHVTRNSAYDSAGGGALVLR